MGLKGPEKWRHEIFIQKNKNGQECTNKSHSDKDGRACECVPSFVFVCVAMVWKTKMRSRKQDGIQKKEGERESRAPFALFLRP